MKYLGRRTDSESAGWVSISDLMAGLMIIFLFIAIAFIHERVPELMSRESQVRNIVVSWQDIESQIARHLKREFSEAERRAWKMQIIEKSLIIRFKSPEVLFSNAEYELSDFYRKILTNFFPRYILVLEQYDSWIEEVRIEGHTSSTWKSATKQEAFINNMELSQKRTMSVLKHSVDSIPYERWRKWAEEKVTATGFSSSKLITDAAEIEDESASRRVEFRVVTNTRGRIERIINALETDETRP